MKKLLIVLALAAVALTGCFREPIVIETLFPGDTRMWDNIYDTAGEPQVFENVVRGLILPHHSVTAKNVARIYDGLSATIDPSVIVVVGPNHFEAGENYIQTCRDCLYKTTKGNVLLEEELIDGMVDADVAHYADEVFVEEHAIFTHTPFIKKYFPEARMVPIILTTGTPFEDLRTLANHLKENLPEDALVISSVDFSHYVPENVADFHDLASAASIQNFDYENLPDIEVDSPESLYALMYLMEQYGYKKARQVDHTNLADFLTEHEEETTSHLYYAFEKGEIAPYQGISIMAFGNMPKDSTLEFMTNWIWNRYYDQTADQSTERELRDIKAKEDRFLRGADFLLFDAVDDECVKHEQNNMTVSFCKFLEDGEREQEYRDMINSEDSDLVVILFEYQVGERMTEERKITNRGFVINGADIVIGRGLEETEEIEKYGGKLIFHSLGDFILDNQLITDLNATSSGMVLGLHIEPQYYHVYTFPVVVNNGYPTLVDYSKRAQLFNLFTGEPDVENGLIKFVRNVYNQSTE